MYHIEKVKLLRIACLILESTALTETIDMQISIVSGVMSSKSYF